MSIRSKAITALAVLLLIGGTVLAAGPSQVGTLVDTSPDKVTTYMFTYYPSGGHVSADHATDLAAADVVVDLAGVTQAWGNLNSSDGDGNWSGEYFKFGMKAMNWQLGKFSSSQAHLWRVDLASHLPAGAQIEDAKINKIVANVNINMALGDSLGVFLLNDDQDQYWYTNNVLNSNGFTQLQSCNWDWQYPSYTDYSATMSSAFTSRTGAGASSQPWSFGTFTQYAWDFSDICDYSYDAGGAAGSNATVTYEADNCVQALVNGETNHGFVFCGEAAGTAINAANLVHIEASTNATKRPWIVVKVLNKSYKSRFPDGKDVALVFSTDDNYRVANLGFADLFKKYNGSYSIYLREDNYDNGSTYLSYADLAQLWKDGFEIGGHSRWHSPGTSKYSGFNIHTAAFPYAVNEYVPGIDPTTFTGAATGWDSLMADTDPVWIYDWVEAGGADRDLLLQSDYCAKTLAAPRFEMCPEVMHAIHLQGYKGFRYGGVNNTTVNGVRTLMVRQSRDEFGTTGPTANSDTLVIGGPYRTEFVKANRFGVPLTSYSYDIVGARAANPSMKEVRWRARQLFSRAAGTDIGAVVTYTHDTKTGPYSDGGIDFDEMEAILSVADSMGVYICGVSEYLKHVRQNMGAIATPGAYPNTNPWTATDGVWFEPLPYRTN